jgi:hypothetical protein
MRFQVEARPDKLHASIGNRFLNNFYIGGQFLLVDVDSLTLMCLYAALSALRCSYAPAFTRIYRRSSGGIRA